MKIILLVFFSVLVLAIISCGKDEMAKPAAGENLITSFSIPSNINSGLSDTLFLEIKGNKIFGRVPVGIQIDSLIPSFEILGAAVKVGGVTQQSGSTINNFRKRVQYDVYALDGTVNSYEVFIQYFTGLPVINIAVAGDIRRGEYATSDIEVFGSEAAEDFKSKIKIRGRGNSTWNHPKKSYQIKFDEKRSLLGMPEDKRWILLANYSDKTMIRNELALTMGRFSDLDWTPESRFVELFLNGEYWGTYQVTQKVEETKNRVDVGNKGFLLEVDQLVRLDDNDVYFETGHYLYNIKSPDVLVDDEDYLYIKNFIEAFRTTLFSDNFKDPVYGYRRYIDVVAFADWYIINELTRNNDAIFHTSVYMNLIPDGKLKMGPIWDFDIAMGNINYGQSEEPLGFYVKEKALWYKRLFEDEYFVNIVKNRFAFFTENKDFLFGEITRNATRINDSQIENFEKWDILGVYVWPNFVFPETYEEELVYLRDWLSNRWDWMESAIADL